MLFDIAIRASQGARRAQEDSALAWPCEHDIHVKSALPTVQSGRAAAVLCDGMGGHIGGAIASRTATETFLPTLLLSEGSVGERLLHALEQSNIAITDQINRDPTFNGMGSTLVGIEVDTDGLWWVSVGDSLLYLWRDGEIVSLNADHSLAPEIDKLASTGKITWAAAHADPRRHYLRSALTGDEIEMIDLAERAAPLLEGDVIVLASDGINTLDPLSIARSIATTASAGAASIATQLIANVDAAREPHQDNTTIVAIRVGAARYVDTPKQTRADV